MPALIPKKSKPFPTSTKISSHPTRMFSTRKQLTILTAYSKTLILEKETGRLNRPPLMRSFQPSKSCQTGKPLVTMESIIRPTKIFHAEQLAYLTNSIFKFRYFPKIWRYATIVPIKNPGEDTTQTRN